MMDPSKPFGEPRAAVENIDGVPMFVGVGTVHGMSNEKLAAVVASNRARAAVMKAPIRLLGLALKGYPETPEKDPQIEVEYITPFTALGPAAFPEQQVAWARTAFPVEKLREVIRDFRPFEAAKREYVLRNLPAAVEAIIAEGPELGSF